MLFRRAHSCHIFKGPSVCCLEKAMAPHSSTLAWRIPWTEEPGRLQSMGSGRVRHNWATSLSLFTFMHWRRKWQPTPVFLSGESQGWRSLVGCRLWGRTESDTTDATWQQQQQQQCVVISCAAALPWEESRKQCQERVGDNQLVIKISDDWKENGSRAYLDTLLWTDYFWISKPDF